ncbi:MAG: hypothetical protein A4E55_01377 [Pelotomaculum sp. PtaU1.Bin035]|nr:MAG: hypothetical protein A4E55_01377 [Pelotomaculum sp. PtaU1.Bin035]
MEGKEYLTSVIAFQAAPTVKGKKPSSLMAFNNSRGKDYPALWKRYGQEICRELELQYFELKEGDGNVLVLFYRKAMLERYVSNKLSLQFLKSVGYGEAITLEQKLQVLKQRFIELCPHEVGIFLGIPIGDVEGFIRHKGKGCLMCRYWKVYSNPRRAELFFKDYDKARSSVAISVANNTQLRNVVKKQQYSLT